MSPVVDIIIRTIDQSGDIGKFTSKLGSLAAQYLSVAAVAGTAYKVINDSIKTTLDYADSVRRLSEISGQSTEETSRFIQVLDDYKITANDAMVATRALTKEGHAPSIQTLAQLSDQYLKLGSAQEKNEFILKNLGRSGLQWVEILNKGSKTILEQGAAIDKSLILSQKMVDEARKNEVALDNWNDSVQALKISIGNELLPVLTSFVNGINEGARAAEIMQEKGLNPANKASQEYRDALRQAHEEQVAATQAMVESTSAMEDQGTAAEDTAKKLQELSDANQAYISGVLSYANAQNSYEDNRKNGLEQLSEAQQRLTQATHEYGVNSQQALEAGTDVTKAKENLQSLEDEWKKHTAQMVFDMMQANFMSDKLLSETETKALEAYGKETGLFTEAQAKQYQYYVDIANAKTRQVEGATELSSAHTDANTRALELLKTEELIEQQLIANRSAAFDFASAIPNGGGIIVGGGGHGGGGGTKKATGTSGWETVPSGFPNDSYPVWMSSGEKYNVQPAGASTGKGGGNTYIVNNYFPAPESADDATRRALLSLSYTGSDLP